MVIGLYRQLLGSAWNDLHETVRNIHADATPVQASGSFSIRHGNGRMARFLIKVLRMPLAGETIPTRLTIFPDGHKEKWLRTFADQPLVTTQWQGRCGMLVERFGAMELRFRLNVQNGALVYRQTGAAVRLGLFPIPLPDWLVPQVTAREVPAGEPHRIHVAVQVVLPLVGQLISYDGSMTRKQAS